MDKAALQEAVSAVKQNRLSIRKAAAEYNVPRTTISDHINGRWLKTTKGPDRQLSDEEENALSSYMVYMSRHGFPLTRAMARCFVMEIVKKSGKHSLFNAEKGPSDEWFRKFFGRHPELTERKPQEQDRSRAAMSSKKTMDQYFKLLEEVLDNLGIKDKPSQIFNCDETGWTGKEASRTKVIGSKDSTFSRKRVTAVDHITAHLCVSAEGRYLPTMVIFKGSLPHRSYKDGIPDSWLFAASESGYMDTTLFTAWFVKIFIPQCGRERPVLLVLDNHDSHISLGCIEEAKANGIELLGLPGHTTHILQPLDLKLIGPLESRFSSTANNLGITSSNATIGKAKFPIVLKYALDKATPKSIQDAFAEAGLCPFNPSAFPSSKLVPPTFVADSSDPGTSETSTVRTCGTCGSYLNNPLVSQGLIPESLAGILVPPPVKPLNDKKKQRLVTESRVFTGEEMLNYLKEREAEVFARKEEKDRRQKEREEKKEKRRREEEEKAVRKAKRKEEKEKRDDEKNRRIAEKECKRQERLLGELDSPIYTCHRCGVRGRVNDEKFGIMWYGCDEMMCGSWYHLDCLSVAEREYLNESLDENNSWYCRECKPWLYMEE